MLFASSPGRAGALACLAAGLIPLVVAPSLPGCSGVCPAVGCITGATVSVAIPDDADLRGATVTACFNDACVGSDPFPVFIPAGGTGVAFPADSGVMAGLWPPDMNGGRRIVVTWWFRNDTTLRTGDRYYINVDSYGNLVADKEETAIAYDKTEICHGACYTARFADPSP